MAGTTAGGMKAKKTIEDKYGKQYWVDMGRAGGKVGRTGGFYVNRELAREAGAKGGRISKRGPAKPKPQPVKQSVWQRIVKGATHG